MIHLRPVIRISPNTYQDGVAEIPHHFGNGHVVSVDFSFMTAQQAARLIDFCSGYLLGMPGWLFRAADKVIVLTPIIGRAEDDL
ncbi:MAG: cell division protein SepF [Ktedonobacteraceae bacterium]